MPEGFLKIFIRRHRDSRTSDRATGRKEGERR
jgi:hypothetical protein